MINKIQKAAQLIQLGRYQNARRILVDILEENPELPFVYEMLAQIAYQEGEYEACIAHGETCLAQDPENDMAFYLSGLSYHYLEYSVKGVQLIEEAIALDPQRSLYKLGLAEVLIELDHHGRAETICRQVIEDEPSYAEAYAILAELAQRNGQKKEAQFYAEEALRLNPGNSSIQILLGQLALKQHQVDKSSALLGQAVLSDPGNPRLREHLIDAELGKAPVYRWFVMKARAFFVIGYLTVFLHYFVVGLGMLAMRQKNVVFDWYLPLKYGLFICVGWMILFWVVRLGGHYVFSRNRWNLSLTDFMSPMYLVHLGMTVTLICMLLYMQTGNFLWIGATLVIGFLLAQIVFTELLIKDAKQLNLVRIYQGFIALIGMGVFVGYWNSFGYVRLLSEVLVFGLFGLSLLWMIGLSVWDSWKEKKGLKAKDIDKKIKDVDTHSTTFDKIIGYAFYPLIIIAPFSLTLMRIEFYNVSRVVTFCGIAVVIIELTMYFVYKKFRPSFLSLKSTTQSSEGRVSAIMRSALTYAALAVIMFLTVVLLSGTRSSEWVPHEILRHDYKPERNEKSHMVVKWLKPKKLRPPSEIMKVTQEKDCIDILLEEKMLGITLLVDYRLCE